jgi:hypothetical protein
MLLPRRGICTVDDLKGKRGTKSNKSKKFSMKRKLKNYLKDIKVKQWIFVTPDIKKKDIAKYR